jgi:hypothetical protein
MKVTIDRFGQYLIKNLIRLTIILITVIYFTSCCSNAETYKVSNDFKKFFFFPAGSWWVYKNQFGAFDTLTLLSTDSKMNKMNAESCDKYECITLSYKSSLKGLLNVTTQTKSDFFTICEVTSPHNYFTELTDFGTYTNGEQKAQSCSSDIEWWIEDTVVIDNKKYYDVIVNKTTSFIPTSISDFPLKGYFKENIGLIKRELQNGEIWELVDYKLNK